MKRKTRGELMQLLRRELNACVKCGNCMAPCPLFQQTRQEAFNMRGKIAVLQALDAGVRLAPGQVSAALSKCLGCQSCKAACPNGVDTSLAMLLGRMVFGLPEELRLPEELAIQARKRLLRHRFSLAFLPFLMHGVEALTSLETVKTMISRAREVLQFAARPDPVSPHEVVVFPGCSLQQQVKEMESLRTVLQAAGIRASILSSSECCGWPALEAGDFGWHEIMVKSLFRFLRQNGGRKVVFACAKCLYNFKLIDKIYSLTPAERELVNNAVDLYSFLDSAPFPVKSLLPSTATFHDPCIQCRALKIKEPPRRLLRTILSGPLVESWKDGSCCGYGHGFFLREPALGNAILKNRAEFLASKKTELVVSTDMQCLDALSVSLRKKGIRVRHLLDLLAESLGGAEDQNITREKFPKPW